MTATALTQPALTFPDGPDEAWEYTAADGTFIAQATTPTGRPDGYRIQAPGHQPVHVSALMLAQLADCQEMLQVALK